MFKNILTIYNVIKYIDVKIYLLLQVFMYLCSGKLGSKLSVLEVNLGAL